MKLITFSLVLKVQHLLLLCFLHATSHTSSFTFTFKTVQKNADMTVWNVFLREWFYSSYPSDNQPFLHMVCLIKINCSNWPAAVCIRVLSDKYCLTGDVNAFAWRPICIPNGNRWWLTSKWSTKGTGKTLEEQARERTDPYVWVLTETSSTSQHKLSQRHKNRGKIDLLPWAQSRGEDLTSSQLVFETKHLFYWPNKTQFMKYCTKFSLEAEEFSHWNN